MRYAREHGFPTPDVHEVSGVEMIMERVDGPTMLDDLIRDPSGVASHARTLAGLHARLHAIPGPAWLHAPFGDPTALLHLDLHPANVLLTTAGPMVIDWPDAVAGPPPADIAQTWLIIGAGEAPELPEHLRQSIPLIRAAFLDEFLAAAGREQAARLLRAVATRKLGDRDIRDAERRSIEYLVASETSARLSA